MSHSQSNEEKRGVGINPASQVHYIEHLAPICILMGIPLLFLEEQDCILGKKYYPDLKTIYEPYTSFSPEYLIANYDVLFMSDLWDRRVFHQKFEDLEKKYHKTLRNVHCPHGFSDKGFYLQKCANEDITLIYGQNMIDQLKLFGVFENLNSYVITGNHRYTYYKEHQEFFDKIVQEEVLSHFEKPQKVILYAPTWLDLEESSTFFECYSHLLDNLPAHYNLIVKLHPRLELDDAGTYYHIIGKYEERKNIYFLNNFPLIYPLLAFSDIYIGDMSSIGYDFLAFNKPMFFLNKQRRNPHTDRGLFLFKCGIEIRPEKFAQIYQIIEDSLQSDQAKFATIRQEVYQYTFGEERPFEAIKRDIIHAYNS